MPGSAGRPVSCRSAPSAWPGVLPAASRRSLPDRELRVIFAPKQRTLAIVRQLDEVLYRDRPGDTRESGVVVRRLDLRTGEISSVSLDAFHFSTRVLTRLMDALEWAPWPGSHLTQDDCEVPWVTRTGGHAGHLLVSRGDFLFFLSRDRAWPVEPGRFVAPVDLSASPAAAHPFARNLL